MVNLNGHGLGRKPDSADARDRKFAAPRVLPTLPAFMDLRSHLPPVYDQGETNSCGAQSAAALMTFLFPEVKGGFSRDQIYWSVRVIEGDTDKDDGIETRNVMKVLEKVGAAPEAEWPFEPKNLFAEPPASVFNDASKYRIASYERLVGATDYLSCLASGLPFVLGFMVPESLDGDDVNRTGILPIPDLKKESIVGGHDVLVVGYDRTFKRTPFFEASGIPVSQVDNTMLLIRNSWGPKWSPKFRGHFWMPLSYATNPTTGGDAWAAKRSASVHVGAAAPDHAFPMTPVPAPRPASPTPHQLEVAFQAARKALDETGYGGWVSDAKLRPVSDEIATAVIKAA